MRQLSGGDPIRVADHPTDDREPAFSHDGRQVAFRSEHDGGGVYVVQTLGGQPRLLAKYGRRPRYSPDGKWVAYWIGSLGLGHVTGRGSGKIYVVPAAGGTPREIQPQFAAARYPVWSPDGKWLLFAGNRTPATGLPQDLQHYAGDWFVAPIHGGDARETGIVPLLRQEQLSRPIGTVQTAPGEWRDNRVIFAAMSGDSTNLWQIPLSMSTLRPDGPPQRLTFGSGLEVQPALGARSAKAPGAPIVFASLTTNMDIWSLPLRERRSAGSSEPNRLTEDAAADFVHSVSPDDNKVVFLSNRTGKFELWMKNLQNGSESPFITTRGRAMFSADGTAVGHTIPGPTWPLYVTPANGGISEKICEHCGTYWHWSSDTKRIIYVVGERTHFEVLDRPSGKRYKFLQHPELDLYLPLFLPMIVGFNL